MYSGQLPTASADPPVVSAGLRSDILVPGNPFAECDLQQRGIVTHVAWCQSSNLIAVSVKPRAGEEQVIYIMEPTRIGDNVAVVLPLQGADEIVVNLAWSPVGCRRALLAATSRGTVCIWTQLQKQGADSVAHVRTIDQWYAHEAVRLDAQLVSATCLRPPSVPLKRDADPSESMEPMVLRQLQHDRHWVRPALLALALITADGRLHLTWAVMGGYGRMLVWQSSPPVALTPPLQTVTVADCVAVGGVALRVALASREQPGVVRLLQVAGDPCHQAAPLQVFEIAVLRLQMGHVVAAVRLGLTAVGPTVWVLSEDSQGTSLGVDAFLAPNDTFEKVRSSTIPYSATSRPALCACLSHGGDTLAVAALNSLHIVPLHFEAPVRSLALPLGAAGERAPAASPSVVAFSASDLLLCAVHSPWAGDAQHPAGCPVVQVAAVTQHAASMPAQHAAKLAQQLAVRTAWAVVATYTCWDIVKVVRFWSRTLPNWDFLQHYILAANRLVHSLPADYRNIYGRPLDRAKLQILHDVPHKDAEVAALDTAFRLTLEYVEACIRLAGDEVQRMIRMKLPTAPNLSAADFEALVPFTTWTCNATMLTLQMLKKWLQLQQAGRRDEAAQLPLVRMLSDHQALHRMVRGMQHINLIRCAMKPPPAVMAVLNTMPPVGIIKGLYSVLMKLGKVSARDNGGAGGEAQMQKDIEDRFPSRFPPHFYRVSNTIAQDEITLEDMRIDSKGEGLKEISDITDEEAATAMRSLGLYVTFALETPAAPRSVVEHKRFRQEACPVAPDAWFCPSEPLHKRRRHWRAQAASAVQVEASQQRPAIPIDIVSRRALPAGWVWSCEAVDASGATVELGTETAAKAGGSSIHELMQRSWLVGAPVTGSLWRKPPAEG